MAVYHGPVYARATTRPRLAGIRRGPESYVLPYGQLGDEDVAAAGGDSATVQAWRADVTARGNLAVRDPKTGALAERTKTPPYTYTLAPFSVRFADGITAGESGLVTSIVGPVAAAGEAIGRTVLDAPSQLVSNVTGLPKGAVKLGLGAALALLAYNAIAGRRR